MLWICLLLCLEIGVRITLSADLTSSPHRPQWLIACLVERKGDTSPISRTQVRAVSGPTPGIVRSRSNRPDSSGSRSNALNSVASKRIERSICSRHSFKSGRMLSLTSSLDFNQLIEVALLRQSVQMKNRIFGMLMETGVSYEKLRLHRKRRKRRRSRISVGIM